MDLVAHRGNASLVEEELGGMTPARTSSNNAYVRESLFAWLKLSRRRSTAN
jgi:hypothetical protein